MIVDTTSLSGEPWCPICHDPVEREGQFCSPDCWLHFHNVAMEWSEPIEINYLDIHEQPWYGDE